MKPNHDSNFSSPTDADLVTQIAFHEAGHAAGIYLYNKQKRLPALFFDIQQHAAALDKPFTMQRDAFIAHVEGGYLIDNLPIDLLESASFYSDVPIDPYQASFEADMVNLLVGALAEAKHVALRDGLIFDVSNVATLQVFGGASDLDKVYGYLERFVANAKQREILLINLLAKAWAFVNTPSNWLAIERLAEIILANPQQTISSEMVIAVLDT
mgnify:CR=1 FL=1